MHVKFQGGFVGRDCHLEASNGDGSDNYVKVADFYPEDINSLQVSFDTNIERQLYNFISLSVTFRSAEVLLNGSVQRPLSVC